MKPELKKFLDAYGIQCTRLSPKFSLNLKRAAGSTDEEPCYQIHHYPVALQDKKSRLLVQHQGLKLGYILTQDRGDELDFIIPKSEEAND